ncbi:MAG: DUF3575 domain-containing protein [Rikenellaceae bacterium]
MKITHKLILYCGLTLMFTSHLHSASAQGVKNHVDQRAKITEIASTTIVDNSMNKNPIAIKTNLAQWGVGVSNIGLEVLLKKNISIDVPLTFSPYTISDDWKLRLLILQPEARYWLNGSCFAGHFVGLHAHAGYFNVAVDSKNRYQNNDNEPLWGFGIGYGYALSLMKNLNIEFNIGAGYANLKYDIYYNVDNGAKFDYDTRDYWGITRAGISISYIINYNK